MKFDACQAAIHPFNSVFLLKTPKPEQGYFLIFPTGVFPTRLPMFLAVYNEKWNKRREREREFYNVLYVYRVYTYIMFNNVYIYNIVHMQ